LGTLTVVPRSPRTPPELVGAPFRGSDVIASGLLTRPMLAGASWRRLFPDVYVHRSVVPDHRVWCAAAALVLPPGAAIGGPSAAYLWGVATLRAPVPVHVVTPRFRNLRWNGRIVAHYTRLASQDVTCLSGLPVTTCERTMFDLGRRSGRADALVVLDAMLHRHLLDPGALRRMVRERHRWPGVSRLARLLALADPRSESPMETRLRLLLVDAGVAPPEVQFEVRAGAGGLVGRVDLAWPDLRLAVEYDGDHHRERAQFRRDVERLNALRLAGWTVLRFTADDVLRRPAETARTVVATIAQLERQSRR
jgi:hypothetical protein